MTAAQRKRLASLIIAYAHAQIMADDDDGNNRLRAKQDAALERALDFVEKLTTPPKESPADRFVRIESQ